MRIPPAEVASDFKILSKWCFFKTFIQVVPLVLDQISFYSKGFTQYTMFDSSAPIGIFDSGIGGMTVASAVTRLLPQENTIYFGDTAHLPYGDKSTAAI